MNPLHTNAVAVVSSLGLDVETNSPTPVDGVELSAHVPFIELAIPHFEFPRLQTEDQLIPERLHLPERSVHFFFCWGILVSDESICGRLGPLRCGFRVHAHGQRT
jgi:hypothetical protein